MDEVIRSMRQAVEEAGWFLVEKLSVFPKGEISENDFLYYAEKIKQAYPELPSPWFRIAWERMREANFSLERLTYAVDNMLESVSYSNPKPASLLSFDVQFYAIAEDVYERHKASGKPIYLPNEAIYINEFDEGVLFEMRDRSYIVRDVEFRDILRRLGVKRELSDDKSFEDFRKIYHDKSRDYARAMYERFGRPSLPVYSPLLRCSVYLITQDDGCEKQKTYYFSSALSLLTSYREHLIAGANGKKIKIAEILPKVVDAIKECENPNDLTQIINVYI